jgi:hypothetical protein
MLLIDPRIDEWREHPAVQADVGDDVGQEDERALDPLILPPEG